MWIALLAKLAVAQDVTPPPPVDLDGDGVPETFTIADEAIMLNGEHLVCDEVAFACQVTVVDVRSTDPYKELLACYPGPRDGVYCDLFTARGGALKRIDLVVPGAPETLPIRLIASGNGVVLADVERRPYAQRHKFVLSEDGLRLSYVQQPYFVVGAEVLVDETFPITMEPGRGAVVANVRPESEITVLMESATAPGFILVRVSSGLVGWTSWAALIAASGHLRAGMGAG